jgi:cellobiose-specific phosphotransferase system component IIB
MGQQSIDSLATKRSLIDLEGHSNGDFGLDNDFLLSFIFDDIILVEFIDSVADEGAGDVIKRGGIFIPTNALNKAWRKAKVILTGPNVKYAKKDDIVMFPNDKGVTISNVDIEGHGMVKKGMFLNEDRLFGICKVKT